MNEPKIIKRGEIYWVDWSPGRGSEQTGKRPALIIQNDIGNTFSPTTIVAAITTASIKDYPFVVSISKKASGLPQDAKVNLSAILTIDKSSLGEKCGQLPRFEMLKVDKAIRSSLDLQ
jgi:mRNA interferase MazF